MTYIEVVEEGRRILREAGVVEYSYDALFLLEEILGINKTRYLLIQREEIPESFYEQYMEAVHRRALREPLQYITGRAYFMGYEYKVNPGVLIPRMDTECLVEHAESVIRQWQVPGRILDMCTGSGCIVTSLTLRNKTKIEEGVGVDISPAALSVARENAGNLSCENVRFLESDLFSKVEGKFSLIVSNPPYIPTEVIEGLMAEVKEHEPFNALDGHEDGLFFYEKITEQSHHFLLPGGSLCYEIGYDQGEQVVAMMEKNGFKDCRVYKDLAGLDRVVAGHL
ncbi:MAG: peptide chain release factor N(5)-glutamine methyltransferase [Lachnospiraceae bacterium]